MAINSRGLEWTSTTSNMDSTPSSLLRAPSNRETFSGWFIFLVGSRNSRLPVVISICHPLKTIPCSWHSGELSMSIFRFMNVLFVQGASSFSQAVTRVVLPYEIAYLLPFSTSVSGTSASSLAGPRPRGFLLS